MNTKLVHIKSISQLHNFLNYEAPKHPLISLINYDEIDFSAFSKETQVVIDIYAVSLKNINSESFIYGRKSIDFEGDAMLCTSPGQIVKVNPTGIPLKVKGWGLYFHPDLIRNSFLATKIKDYSFFSYSENESLHLSETENKTLQNVIESIKKEYSLNIDAFSQDLIISNIEVLLNYCKRFYGRQFITRTSHNKDVIIRFEKLIAEYFRSKDITSNGLPSVTYCANKLALSSNYLSDILKQETGKSAMEHIHYHLIETAKDLLANSTFSISEVAYDLGFEQPQNFSRLFKKKTGESPSEYRTRLN